MSALNIATPLVQLVCLEFILYYYEKSKRIGGEEFTVGVRHMLDAEG